MASPERLFETPRLDVRRVDPVDLDAMVAVYGDAGNMRWVGDGKALSRADCERWIEITARNYAARGYGMFAVVLSATGDTVGFCGLVHPANQETAELKYAYRRECWGRGYATEAAAALLAHGARAFGIAEVIATVAPENTASHRVLDKLGMRRVTSRRNDDGSSTEVFTWSPPAA